MVHIYQREISVPVRGMVRWTRKSHSNIENYFVLFLGTSNCVTFGGSLTFEEHGLHYIRGLLSVSAFIIVDKERQQISCDPTQYLILTDVAQYLPWIDEVTNE